MTNPSGMRAKTCYAQIVRENATEWALQCMPSMTLTDATILQVAHHKVTSNVFFFDSSNRRCSKATCRPRRAKRWTRGYGALSCAKVSYS